MTTTASGSRSPSTSRCSPCSSPSRPPRISTGRSPAARTPPLLRGRRRPVHDPPAPRGVREAVRARKPRRLRRRGLEAPGLRDPGAGARTRSDDVRGDSPEEGERDEARPRARRPCPAGRPRRARRALPDPFRPHLRLPARQRRQPPRRRGPDDADVPEDARVDREVPLAVRAVLRLALPDRAQPGDGPLPRDQALAAGGGGARAAAPTSRPRRRPARSSRSGRSRCSS